MTLNWIRDRGRRRQDGVANFVDCPTHHFDDYNSKGAMGKCAGIATNDDGAYLAGLEVVEAGHANSLHAERRSECENIRKWKVWLVAAVQSWRHLPENRDAAEICLSPRSSRIFMDSKRIEDMITQKSVKV